MPHLQTKTAHYTDHSSSTSRTNNQEDLRCKQA